MLLDADDIQKYEKQDVHSTVSIFRLFLPYHIRDDRQVI